MNSALECNATSLKRICSVEQPSHIDTRPSSLQGDSCVLFSLFCHSGHAPRDGDGGVERPHCTFISQIWRGRFRMAANQISGDFRATKHMLFCIVTHLFILWKRLRVA